MRNVDPSDPNAYPTIGTALAQAAAGDHIHIAPGTYEEAVTLALDGLLVEGDDVTIHADSAVVLRATADGDCLQGLAIAGGGPDALVATGADGLHLTDVAIHDAPGSGIVLRGLHDAQLDNVTVSNVGANALLATDVDGLAVTGGSYASSSRGVHVLRGSRSAFVATHIGPVGEDGLVVENTAGPVAVSYATIVGGVFGAWVLGSSNVTFTASDLSAFRDVGLRVDGSHAIQMTGGSIHDGAPASNDAIHIEGSSAISMTDVGIHDVPLNGIYVRGSTGIAVAGATISNAKRGIHLLSSGDDHVTGTQVSHTSENGLVLETMTGPSTLSDDRFTDNTWSLWVLRADATRISRTVIDNQHDRALRVEGSHDVAIDNLTIASSPSTPTRFGLEGLDVQRLTVVDSELANTLTDGAIVLRSSDVRFARLTVHDSYRGMHLVDVTRATVTGSRFTGLGENGIVVEPGRNVTVQGNTLQGGAIGIWFRGGPNAQGNVVRDNTVSGFTSSGISLDLGAKNHLVTGNDVHGNHRGIKVLDGGGAPPGTVTASNTFSNNHIEGNDYGVWSDNTRGTNLVKDGTLHGNLVCDIMTRNETTLDLRGVDFGSGATANDLDALFLQGTKGPLRDCADGGKVLAWAKALTDHQCSTSRWHFVINQLPSQANAPRQIHVAWSDGREASIPLASFSGKTAQYATDKDLDHAVIAATAPVDASWRGQFNLSDGPCSVH